MSNGNRSIDELIAGELSAIRQAVEARGPVDVDALARRVNELSRMDGAAAVEKGVSRTEVSSVKYGNGEGSPLHVRAGPSTGSGWDAPQYKGAGAEIFAPGYQPVQRRVEGGKFDGMLVDDVVFVRNFLQRAAAMNPSTVRPPTDELEGIAKRALSGTATAAGAEYVPTGMAAQLWLDMFLQSKIVANMQVIPMPTNPFDLPLGWGAVTWRKGTRNVQTTPQDPPTAKTTLTATEQVVEVDWDYTLDEDAVIAVLPTLRRELTRSAGEQMDAFVLNADSDVNANTNINLIDGTPANDAYYLSAGGEGIRNLFLIDNTAQLYNMAGAALTDAGVLACMALCGKYAADPSRLLMIVNAKTYINGLMAIGNVRTREKFGPDATILTGQLASYSGVPIIVSESASLTKNDGKVSATAGNNVYGQLSIVNRDMWRVGFRRELLIEIDRDVKKRQFVMVVSFRIAVSSRGTRSSSTHTSGMKYILV